MRNSAISAEATPQATSAACAFSAAGMDRTWYDVVATADASQLSLDGIEC